MNKKLIVTSLFGLATLTVAGGTYAFGQGGQRPELDEATRTAIHEAVQAEDYDAFVEAVEGTDLEGKITEEKFANFGQGRGEGMGNGPRADLTEEELAEREAAREERQAEMEAHRAAVDEAMSNKDFAAWQEVAQDEVKEIIDTEAEFLKLVEAHEYMQKAREIREELGLPEMGRKGGMEGAHGKMGNMEGNRFGGFADETDEE